MPRRRLIAAPAVALVASLLVGAVIDTGQRARQADDLHGTTRVVASDPALTAEASRVRAASSAVARCSAPASCSAESTAARVRHAALAIDQWPRDPRFQVVRDTLREQLHAQAALLDLRAATRLDGRVSPADRARIRTLQQRLDDTTTTAARAQRAAGIIDRAALDAVVAELR